MTSLQKIKSLFSSQKSPPLTPLANFLTAPDTCIFGSKGQHYDWIAQPTLYPSLSALEDIRFDSLGKTIGYSQQMSVNSSKGVACIGHFATHKDFTRMKAGYTMAQTLQKHLQLQFGVGVMVFRENSYANANYGEFFSSLGATSHQEKRAKHPTWIWNFGQSTIPTAEILSAIPY